MKIVSVNIEDKKHISKIVALIEREQPEMLFLQEVCEKDLETFSNLMGGSLCFAPMAFKDTLDDNIGIAIFSKFETIYEPHVLKPADRVLTTYSSATFEDRFMSQSYYAIEAQVTVDAVFYRFYNTHLPVTEKGSTTSFQLETVENLLTILSQKPEVILVGDTNAPRGGEAFSKLAAVYIDNIPASYTTSIDGTLHRAGAIERMVDVFFTTPQYAIDDVTFIKGVSDHYALSANIAAL
jgi:endonuclease/exonuclease/phosphatase family metal-dependent hydrolase